MSKGGGGGGNTEGLEEASAAAIKLQREMYEQGRSDIQPWYQMGTGATSKLSDLLGITGGSVQSEGDIRSGLSPQYTTSTTSNAGGEQMFRTADGRILDRMGAMSEQGLYGAPDNWETSRLLNGNAGISLYGSPETTTTTTDYDALNAAVAAQMEKQGQTPEGFGSLLEKFDETKMQDSAGYQFRQEQGQKALERSMAAQGVTMGGGGYGEINPQAAQAMTDYSQGLASQEYGNEYNRYVGDQLNTFNMLMGASGSGQQATGQMAQQGQAYATNVGNLQTGLADAQFQSAQANASQPSMFGTLVGGAAGAFLGNPALGAAAGNAIFGGK